MLLTRICESVAIGALFTLAGCASISILPISPAQVHPSDTKQALNGLRFYPPKFYLEIGGDGSGNCTASIVTLPDTSKPYIVTVSNGLFSNVTFQPTLTDGWNLTAFNGSVDNTAVMSSLISGILGGAAKSGGKGLLAFNPVGAPPSGVNPGLYPLKFVNGVVTVTPKSVFDSLGSFGTCKAVAFSPPANPPANPPGKSGGKPGGS